MKSFELSLRAAPRRTCRIRLGAGAADACVAEVADSFRDGRLVAVSDSIVGPLHASPLAERLRGAGRSVDLLTFAAGEAHKSRASKSSLEDRMAEMGIGSDAALLAIGGGVVGDLAGFVAATWHRGVPVVQVPTTLLSMVDSAVGGKTAVNLPSGKNRVGSVHQPWGVYADPVFLDTLPQEQYVEGLAEVVKMGAIGDLKLFRRLESKIDALRARDPQLVEECIERCVLAKSRVVARDERETGRRAVLNFGHTIGHALEVLLGLDGRHGSAISIGMCVEARLAQRRTGFPPAHVVRLERLLDRAGLPTRLPAEIDRRALVAATYADKKARAGRPRYALPERLGKMAGGDAVTTAADDRELLEILSALDPTEGA